MSRWIRNPGIFILLALAAPMGSYLQAQGQNGILVAEWDANTSDADLRGYRVFAATDPNIFDLTPTEARSRASTVTVFAGNTEATLGSLDPARTYFIAATSFDWSGNESGFSNIVAAQPCATSTSGALTISWDPDTSRELDFYNVYLSDDPGSFDAGPSAARMRVAAERVERDRTTVTFTGLDVERTYYIAVTSTDRGGVETGFAEVAAATASVVPTVCTVSPGSATQGTTDLTITMTGANMSSGSTVDLGPGVSIVSLDTSSAPVRLTAVVDVDPMARVDARDLVVHNPDGGMSTRFDAFNVTVNLQRVDINSSARIDGGDLVQIAVVFGARSGEPGYSPSLDLNVDGIIDGSDLSLLIAYFGQSGPY